MTRPTFDKFKDKALAQSDVKVEYEKLQSTYELRRKLIKLRHAAGMTQEELAKRLNTQKSNISRLESVSTSNSPKLSTIQQYAEATGYELEINFLKKN